MRNTGHWVFYVQKAGASMGDLRTYGTLIGPVKGHSVRDTDIDEQVCMAAVTTIAAFQMSGQRYLQLARDILPITFIN